MKKKCLLILSLFFFANTFAQDSLKTTIVPSKADNTAQDSLKNISKITEVPPADTTAEDDLMNILEEESPVEKKQKVFATFKSTYLINAQTNETVKKGTLDFRITHRFGDVAGSGGGIHNFYGFDNANNIRFSFDYGISDRLQLGIGRSKIGENIDGSIKYKIMEQVEKGFPVSIVAYANMVITPKLDLNNEFGAFVNRFSYSYQIIATTKINRKVSVGLLPTYIHRNMIHAATNSSNGAQETNDIFSAGIMGRVKITQSLALIAEYFYTFSDFRMNNTTSPYYMPLGIGVEIETGGHVFQMNLTNTAGIVNQDFIPTSPDSWLKGQYKLGFTISRVFGTVRQ